MKGEPSTKGQSVKSVGRPEVSPLDVVREVVYENDPVPTDDASEAHRKFLKKVLAVQKAVSSVEKKGYNAFHKYDYMKEEDVVQAIRPTLLDLGLLLRCTQNTPTVMHEEGITVAHLTFKVTDVETGFTETVEAFGTGSDSGSRDKALFKAITGAKKYFVTSYFFLSAGDDPEEDTATDEDDAKKAVPQSVKAAPYAPKTPYVKGNVPAKITPVQREIITNLMKRSGMSTTEVDTLAKASFGYVVPDLTENEAGRLIKLLEKKAEAVELFPPTP